MTAYERPDPTDRAAGLTQNDKIFDLRAQRPEFLNGAEDSRRAVLMPQDDLGLSTDLRHAIAHRVARTAKNPELEAQYPLSKDPDLEALALGNEVDDPRLAAIAAHADMIATSPERAAKDDLDALIQAGFSIPQVIALSELLAFVCFQIRIAHGLALLKGQP